MNFSLFAHLVGAGLLGLVSLFAVAAVLRKKTSLYRPSMITLALGGVYQVVTGGVLAYQTGGSPLSFCSKIAIYLFALILVELMLVRASGKSAVVVPALIIKSSAIVAIIAVVGTVGLLVF
ncbi:MAG: hypothetical protein Q8P33_01940 [bacterium]|nr:hypothetical protein [bacterium]